MALEGAWVGRLELFRDAERIVGEENMAGKARSAYRVEPPSTFELEHLLGRGYAVRAPGLVPI
jgi:hypothetical protein